MKIIYFIYQWAGWCLAAIGLLYVGLYGIKEFGISPETFHAVFGGIGLACLGLQGISSWKNINLDYLTRLCIRVCLASLFVFYALGKVYDLQFAIIGSIQDKKVAALSRFESAWLFFDQSYHYGLFIALGQFLAALLIMVDRFTSFAALLFLGILTNIVVINIEYGVRAMLETSVWLLLMALYLILGDGKRILGFALGKSTAGFALHAKTKLEYWCYRLACLVVLVSIVGHLWFFGQL
jgi:uncharacterized membrane protein YphA (DoxX/SURF4 family)